MLGYRQDSFYFTNTEKQVLVYFNKPGLENVAYYIALKKTTTVANVVLFVRNIRLKLRITIDICYR